MIIKVEFVETGCTFRIEATNGQETLIDFIDSMQLLNSQFYAAVDFQNRNSYAIIDARTETTIAIVTLVE